MEQLPSHSLFTVGSRVYLIMTEALNFLKSDKYFLPTLDIHPTSKNCQLRHIGNHSGINQVVMMMMTNPLSHSTAEKDLPEN